MLQAKCAIRHFMECLKISVNFWNDWFSQAFHEMAKFVGISWNDWNWGLSLCKRMIILQISFCALELIPMKILCYICILNYHLSFVLYCKPSFTISLVIEVAPAHLQLVPIDHHLLAHYVTVINIWLCKYPMNGWRSHQHACAPHTRKGCFWTLWGCYCNWWVCYCNLLRCYLKLLLWWIDRHIWRSWDTGR